MRLLIVEDDPDGREVLGELFRLHDWDVIEVSTPRDALAELRHGGVDVVISDENLEGQSGSSMLRAAAADGLLVDVGALMYTAEGCSLDVPPGVRVLRKPVPIGRLLDEARAAIRSEEHGADARTAPPSSGERARFRGSRGVVIIEAPPSSRAQK